MSRTIFALLVLAAIVSSVWSLPAKCGKNEEWTLCGTMCPATCCQKETKLCILSCFIGCQCKSGYVKNSCNECVLPCDCKCK